MKILVTGLPGSGKSTFSNKLFDALDNLELPVIYYNGDDLRGRFGDWDFSEEGRLRQFNRMYGFSTQCSKDGHIVISDFICPKNSYRDKFDADIVVWMDTIKESVYEDTNKVFETPDKYDIRITNFDEDKINDVVGLINAKRYLRN